MAEEIHALINFINNFYLQKFPYGKLIPNVSTYKTNKTL